MGWRCTGPNGKGAGFWAAEAASFDGSPAGAAAIPIVYGNEATMARSRLAVNFFLREARGEPRWVAGRQRKGGAQRRKRSGWDGIAFPGTGLGLCRTSPQHAPNRLRTAGGQAVSPVSRTLCTTSFGISNGFSPFAVQVIAMPCLHGMRSVLDLILAIQQKVPYLRCAASQSRCGVNGNASRR